MDSSKIKNKVLQKLIEQMDDRMVGDLKGKSPKFAKVEIESDDPELASKLEEKVLDAVESGPMDKMPEDEEEDDDLERLQELYDKLK